MTQPIRMLIADDSRLIRKLIVDAADSSGLPLRLSLTDNGQDCLTMLQAREVDLAFIDVNMPDLSGTDALWAARKLGVQTFVTLLSTPPSREAVGLARKTKAYEFLFKPFKHEDVLAVIMTYARIKAPTRVLVVDDSQTVRRIIQKTIRESIFDCRISEACDGQTAIALCKDTPFDAVFLDCNMPGLSGTETLAQLNALGSAMKIVMISSERETARDAAARHGAFAFLSKPFGIEDMDLMLHRIHGLRSPNLRLREAERDFDVAIEGSTIRLAHTGSGRIFEYLWFKEPPYLRNATMRPNTDDNATVKQLVAAAETAALHRLSSARLLAA
jgi:DNA-binding NtrC family response regulator